MLTTDATAAGLNRERVRTLPAAVEPPAKTHCAEVCEAHGAVLHPFGPDTTWLAVTPPPANVKVEALLPEGSPLAGSTAERPKGCTDRDRWVARPGPVRPRRSHHGHLAAHGLRRGVGQVDGAGGGGARPAGAEGRRRIGPGCGEGHPVGGRGRGRGRRGREGGVDHRHHRHGDDDHDERRPAAAPVAVGGVAVAERWPPRGSTTVGGRIPASGIRGPGHGRSASTPSHSPEPPSGSVTAAERRRRHDRSDRRRPVLAPTTRATATSQATRE